MHILSLAPLYSYTYLPLYITPPSILYPLYIIINYFYYGFSISLCV